MMSTPCKSSFVQYPHTIIANILSWLDKAAKACSEGQADYLPCPSATCDFGCFFSGNIFICRKCDLSWCVSCSVPMHEGETCTDYKDRIENGDARRSRQALEDAATQEEVTRKSKPCPGCGIRIQKKNGCDHMTCKSFEIEFGPGLWQLTGQKAPSARTNSAGSALRTTAVSKASSALAAKRISALASTTLRDSRGVMSSTAERRRVVRKSLSYVAEFELCTFPRLPAQGVVPWPWWHQKWHQTGRS